MASLQHPTTIEKLPGDVLTNIFIRLPAKQVSRMRSVSKPLNDLLSQPSFIKSHLHHSVHNNDETLMIFPHVTFSFDHLPFTVHPTKSPVQELTDFIKLPANAPSKNVDCYVIGSVNGLICFYYQPYHVCTLHMWNPSLSTLLPLPPYTIPSRGYDILFRFGFDPKIDDYKVVKLTGLLSQPKIKPRPDIPDVDYEVKEWLQVEIYSMRNNSWKTISQRFPSHVTWLCDNNEVCVDGHDGHLHWIGCIDKYGELETIIAFDLGVETFTEICLPDSILSHIADEHRFNILGFLAGKLCVTSHLLSAMSCEVWVMDEYGVAESWVKRHVITESIEYMSLYGFTLNNELFCESPCGLFSLYDLVEEKFKHFYPRAKGIARTINGAKIVQYVDSLVWVAPAKCESALDSKNRRKDSRIMMQQIDRSSKRVRKIA